MKWLTELFAMFARIFCWPDVGPKLDTQKRRMTSADGIALIKSYESLSLRAYLDPVGILTIGYGDTQNVTPGMTITEADAEARLRNRLSTEFEPGVLTALTRSPRQCEFDAMVSLAYNIGVSAFKRSTLLKKYNAGDIQGAADQFSVWHYAAKKSVKGLRKRRAAERAVFLGGDVKTAINIGDNTP